MNLTQQTLGALTLAMQVVGCRGASPRSPVASPSSPISIAPAPSAPSPPASPRSVVDPCVRPVEAHRALFAQLSEPPNGEIADGEFATCLRTSHGAWSLEIESLRWVANEQQWRGRWSLVHQDEARRRVAIALTLPTDGEFPDISTTPDNLELGTGAALVRDHAALVDYDGDGEQELVLVLSLGRHESSDPIRGRVWTFRDGRISLYGRASELDVLRSEDVDHDGRADLIVREPFVTTGEAEQSGFSYDITGPEWVFHSLPDGSFSSTDAVAVAAARSQCPSAPERVLLTERGVACARAWGMTTRNVEAAIRRGCGGRAPAEGSSDACTEVAAMHAFASRDAPTPLAP